MTTILPTAINSVVFGSVSPTNFYDGRSKKPEPFIKIIETV
jgi:hypothetical protein